MEKAGVHNYGQVIEYCKEHGIKPSFEATDATVLFIEEVMKTDRPDYLIYMIDAVEQPAPIQLLGIDAKAARIIVVVNKM